MAIESDINNADSRLLVQFYRGTFEDPVATALEGRAIYKETDCIKISIPGDSLNERDRPIYESDKVRFPLQWAHYMNKQGSEEKYEGTPLKEWPLITRSQAEELRARRFYTVESIATASDLQLQSMGMSAGMSPHTLRDKAKFFLESAKTAADYTNREQEIAQLKEENARIKAETDAKMEAMRRENDEKFASLLAAVSEKKPKGRPKATETTQEE